MSIFDNIGHFFFGGPATTKSTSTTNSTTTNNPWAPAIPYVTDYLKNSAALYGPNGAPQISPYEQQGYEGLKQTATNSGSLQAATAQNDKVASGAYLTPDTNPYLKDIADRVAGGAMSAINTTFGGKGRTGSGLHQIYAGQGVGNALTDLYGGEYDKERALQMQAIGNAPQFDAARYVGPEAMINAGQAISARPFDLNAQWGGILGNIAKLGGTQNYTGTTNASSQSRGESNGWFLNKLFPA